MGRLANIFGMRAQHHHNIHILNSVLCWIKAVISINTNNFLNTFCVGRIESKIICKTLCATLSLWWWHEMMMMTWWWDVSKLIFCTKKCQKSINFNGIQYNIEKCMTSNEFAKCWMFTSYYSNFNFTIQFIILQKPKIFLFNLFFPLHFTCNAFSISNHISLTQLN